MIKANELRIGNYAMYDNRIFKIHTIAEVFPTLDTSEFGIGVIDWSNLSPIPLTEEILLKCGFERQYDEGFYDKGKLRMEFVIWADDEPEWKIKRFNGTTFSRHSDIQTKYLHQLQNLVFALTGKELTVNL